MLAGSLARRIVASLNAAPAKSRISTESGVGLVPFPAARSVPSVALSMHFDQGVKMHDLWRKPRPLLAAAMIAGLAFVPSALASPATVGNFYSQETITATDVSLCTGLTGTVTNTVTDAGRYVDTGRTFHVSGTTTQDYRTDWSDGSYLINHSPTHWAFNTNATGQVVYTAAQQDRGTLYSADGQVIGQLNVFTLTHVTWRDANGNGQPDPGEIKSSVDQFRVTC